MSSTGLLAALLLVQACDVPPKVIEEHQEVDYFLLKQRWKSACVALRMEDPELQRYTAMKLVDYPREPVAAQCLCEGLYDKDAGLVREAVAKGLENSGRDDLAACLEPAITDDRIADKTVLVETLSSLGSKEGFRVLSGLAQGSGDPAVRAQSAVALRPSERHIPLLLELLAKDPDPGVRAGAAAGLLGRSGDQVESALFTAAGEDADGGVRGAAFAALASSQKRKVDELGCKLLMEDEDERAREAAARGFHGTKDTARIACLKQRLQEEEPSPKVRRATLDALGASPAQEAADALCESIGPFLKANVQDQIAETMPDVDIIRVHNERDWERSYACVQGAIARGGQSCYGRNHLGRWFRTFGGQAPTPWCPGMEKNTPG
ncbi:MAG: HEAT repeat domain-containing protein [Deltaproteobacteria bacterium]|nr:HEAT repeat domain-containing protein [Deltaproteobacteria bacterium]